VTLELTGEGGFYRAATESFDTILLDMMSAIEQWVEQRRAPARIVASHSTNGAVDRTRPLCRYPQMATSAGSGSIDEAANFVCR
jgi:Tannase and feruloyl esterase